MSGYAIAGTWLLVCAVILTVVSALLKRADDAEQGESIREWLGLEDGEEL